MGKPLNLDATSFGAESPGFDAVPVTPSDTEDLELDSEVKPARALYVGTEGDLRIMTMGNKEITFKAVKGWVPMMTRRVYSSGNSAQDIVAIY